MPGSAREEAERLVAAILARTSTSGDGFGLLGESVAGLIGALGREDLSTGGAECCVCPVCKAIAAVRDPSPETAERLAASAGDIASGVAGLMRAFSSMTAERPRTPAPRSRPAPTPDQAWSAATHVEDEPPVPDAGSDPWGAVSAADAREAAAAARARAAAAEQAVARAVEQAKAHAARTSGHGGRKPSAGGSTRSGDVWAMATTAEVAADDAAEPRSVDHELGASVPEDRDPGQGDDARPGVAV
jgi:hypothetical protein